MSLTDPLAAAFGRSRNFVAVHHAVGVALALLQLGGVEELFHLVVGTMMEATAAGHGDALIAAEHEALVAHAALPAPLGAAQRGEDAAAGPAAIQSTQLVVAVGRAGNPCEG